jgi:hypothetical protein
MAERTTAPAADKRIVRDHMFEVNLLDTRPDEREVIERAIGSLPRLLGLLQNAGYTGAKREYRVAPVTQDLRLILRETPREIHVVRLISEKAMAELGIEVHTDHPNRAVP